MESPTKTIRPPLELHSPSNSNIDDNTPSPNDGKGSAMKGTTPSSSSVVAPLPPRLPADDDNDDNNENENRHTNDDDDGRYEHPFYLSPIGRMDLSTPSTATAATGTNNDMTSETPNNKTKTPNSKESEEEEEVNESFPDNRDETIEIQSPNYNDNDDSNDSLIGDLDDVLNEMNGTAAEEENQDAEDVYDDEEEEVGDNYDEEEEEEEETEEERMQREIEESEALARQLMAEEAMESYAVSNNYLRENADQFSEEDLAALQAAMAEEDPESNNNDELAEDEDAEGDSAELSYDALLRLGERIGDVKEERWALGAQEQINRLPTLTWSAEMAVGKAENHTEVKCQVCQCDYEEGDELRRLPCDHCFHKDCIDSWLQTKDTCALCRKSIVNFSVDV